MNRQLFGGSSLVIQQGGKHARKDFQRAIEEDVHRLQEAHAKTGKRSAHAWNRSDSPQEPRGIERSLLVGGEDSSDKLDGERQARRTEHSREDYEDSENVRKAS